MSKKKEERKTMVYEFVRRKIQEDGYPPSIREIGAHTGISSTSVVYSILMSLAEDGLITFEKNKKRAISIVNSENIRTARVPIAGRVTAGVPILAQENIEGYLNLCTDYCPDDLFALRVMGTSMVGAGIMDGDTVVVHKTPVAENGQIVVAMIDGEATVKRYYRERDTIRLQPENPTMSPIFSRDVIILGRVVSCIRYYA